MKTELVFAFTGKNQPFCIIRTLSINFSVTSINPILRLGFLILETGRAMNGFSKFGICLICMLALVLLAMTPNTTTSNGVVGFLSEPAPTSSVSDFPAGRATV